MIPDRSYEPADGELIYHYCSADAFLSIISSRTARASAHYTMNDWTERNWGYSIFERAINQFQTEGGKAFVDQIKINVDRAYSNSVLMLSCYSLDPDVLSQWRAYADDGRGFAIGFDPKLMKKMPAKQFLVLYVEDEQLRELLGNLKHTFEYEKSIGFRYNMQFQVHWFNIGMDLCSYKNPTFKEEKEIRLAHVSGLLAPEGKSYKFVSLGARDSEGKRVVEPQQIHFRTRDGGIIPYVVLDYSEGGAVSPFKEVILGSRNLNADYNVEAFLNTVGIKDVNVRRSKVTYR